MTKSTLATNYKLCHKIQSRKNVGFFTASNQNEGLFRMTDLSYTSIIWLTQGKYAIVDNEDSKYLSQCNWHFNAGYAVRQVKGDKVLMHRVVSTTPIGFSTDHINRNKLDNRRNNLRVCSHAQNTRNRGLSPTNTSGFKGVTWCKDSSKWRAHIKLNGKKLHLGLYKDSIDAAMAYDQAALELFGEFAKTNKMMGLFLTQKESK
jgi:hypothetical protein